MVYIQDMLEIFNNFIDVGTSNKTHISSITKQTKENSQPQHQKNHFCWKITDFHLL